MAEYIPTYAIGERVQANEAYAHILNPEEVYTVVANTAPVQVGTFRFPEYVMIEDAKGARSTWYPWRFRRM